MRRLVVVGALLGLVSLTQAQDLGGLFSRDGVEVRADARVFTLFALFNALGYDRETERGPMPLEAPKFTAIRQELRVELLGKAKELESARRFVEQHPWSMAEYVERTLRLAQPPQFAAAEGADEGEQQLGALLKEFYAKFAAPLHEARRAQLSEEAKAWLAALDRDTAKARQTVRLGDDAALLDEDDDDEDALRLVLLVNPLDAHGALYRGQDADARYLVVGPGVDASEPAQAMLVEALRELLRPQLRRAIKAQDAAAVSKALQARGVSAEAAKAPDEVLTNVFASLFAARALQRELAATHTASVPQGLLKAAQPAADWYLEQKGSFSELAPAMVGRTLGLKPADSEATKRGS